MATVCVFGATGSQGGSLATQLRDIGLNVRALVRNIDSPKAQSLKSSGVILIQGDWDNSQALANTITGCDKLFLCLLPNFNDQGSELRQVINIVNIAKAVGVKQVVASTSLAVFTLEEGLLEPGSVMYNHASSKRGIEQAVSTAGFEYWTFLRPSFLMANFLEPKVQRYPEPRDKGTWTTSMTAESKLALIDHVDIAKVAIAAFQEPQRFHNKAIGLASQLLTVQETLDYLGHATGRPLRAVYMTDKEIADEQKRSNVFVNSQSSMRLMAKYIDMEVLEAIAPLTTFKEFLDREQRVVKETYG
ncbi:NmrA family protein [Hypoxylon crocopeplum]|nr:NmrA family protein [Hypoxylon crocopeplum]